MQGMLTSDQTAHFKQKLETEKAVLEGELSNLGTRNPSNPSDWVVDKPEGEVFGADKSDNADIIEAEQQNNATLNELEGRLNQVIAALEKIEKGAYGVCEISQEDIEVERLEANAAARTCKSHMQDEATLS